MSVNKVNEFIKLINKRDSALEEHCNGASWTEISNYPEERNWYVTNISPLDYKIIDVANCIIAKFTIPCKMAENIIDVYSNEWLIRLYNQNCKDEEKSL